MYSVWYSTYSNPTQISSQTLHPARREVPTLMSYLQVFYFTHLLYVPFWILLILHAPNFWKWFIVPGTVYLIEKMLRLWWLR